MMEGSEKGEDGGDGGDGRNYKGGSVVNVGGAMGGDCVSYGAGGCCQGRESEGGDGNDGESGDEREESGGRRWRTA
jgi:hypothetical protein